MGSAGRREVCYQDACCEAQCDAVPCGPGTEAAKCGLTSCGTCGAGVCVNGACNTICSTNPCPVGCANCLVTPSGDRICASSANGAQTGTCGSDADCCPGQRCGAIVGTANGRMVCYVLTFGVACTVP